MIDFGEYRNEYEFSKDLAEMFNGAKIVERKKTFRNFFILDLSPIIIACSYNSRLLGSGQQKWSASPAWGWIVHCAGAGSAGFAPCSSTQSVWGQSLWQTSPALQNPQNLPAPIIRKLLILLRAEGIPVRPHEGNTIGRVGNYRINRICWEFSQLFQSISVNDFIKLHHTTFFGIYTDDHRK